MNNRESLQEHVARIANLEEQEHRQCAKAAIFMRAKNYFFSPVSSLAGGGGSLRHEPVLKVAVDCEPAILGEKLVEVLLLSTNDYPYDREKLMSEKDSALLVKAEVKSESTFHRTAHQLGVAHFIGELTFDPKKSKGTRYYGNPDVAFDIGVASTYQEIGEAIIRGFTLTIKN